MKKYFYLLSILAVLFSVSSCEEEENNPTRLDVKESRTFEVMSELKWNDVSISVMAGETYTIVSTGTWTDLTTVTDADGYDDPFLDTFSSLKRNQDASWFELVAAVDESSMYVVGSNATITFNESGNLAFFANDADNFYGNNSGSVSTTITRIN